MSIEAELKSLRVELEQEKAKHKETQEAAKNKADELRKTLEKEKEKEMKLLHESMFKEYSEQIESVQSEYEKKVKLLEEGRKKERSKVREELRQEIEQELSSKYSSDRKKMASEVFNINSQLSEREEEISRLKGIIRSKEELLKAKDEEFQSKVEKLGRSERKNSKQHMDEMEGLRRQMQNKEKELMQMAEKLSHAMADKDRLDEEVRKLKQTDTWVRRSATPTSPSLSPSTSIEELTAVTKKVNKRERDMVIKNSELSFRVRTLEDTISKLKAENTDVKAKLSESRSQLAPLKEHRNKLNVRINDLNASLRSREKKIESLSQEILELKSAKQQLEEDHVRQRKSLQQQLTRCTSFRNEVQKLTEKVQSLTNTNTRLLVRVDRLETDKGELEERVRNFTLTSPTPLTPPPVTPDDMDDETASLDSSASSVQLLEQISQMAFDRDEVEINLQEMSEKYKEMSEKYKEMKAEYANEREKNKSYHSNWETTQRKMKELQTSYRQELSRTEQLEREKLQLESELDKVHQASSRERLYDQERQSLTVESLQRRVDELQLEVDQLQGFIVEQDTIWRKQEVVWAEEKKTLVSELKSLQQGDHRENSLDRVLELEELNSQLNEQLSEANSQSHSLREEIDELNSSLAAKVEEVTSLEASNSQLQEDLQVANDKILSLQEENRELSEGSTAEFAEVAILKTQSTDDLNDTITSLREENAQLTENLEASGKEVANLETSKTQMAKKLESTADEVASLQEDKVQLRGNLKREEQEKMRLNTELIKINNLLKEKEMEHSVLLGKIAQFESQANSTLRSSLEKPPVEEGMSEPDGESLLADKMVSLEEGNVQLKGDLEREVQENGRLRTELDRINNLLREKETEQSVLLEKISELEGQVSSARDLSVREPPVMVQEAESDGESHSATALKQAVELSQVYKQQLEQKEEENTELRESLSLAQESIAELRALLDSLQSTLHTQTEEHQSILGDKDQHISDLTDQLSQASSKLTRLRRAVPVGINHQMASELGHKVKNALRKLSVEIQSSSGSVHFIPHLRTLEEAVNELLHTLFPGSFDAELTPVSSETNLNPSVTSELSSTSERTYQDSVDVPTPTHTTTRHTPLTPPHSSPPTEDERDFSSPAGFGSTYPSKSRESSPGKLTPKWRDSSSRTFTFPTESVVSGTGKTGLTGSPTRTEQAGEEDPRVFVAVMDYEPKSLCTTGHPENEISFSTGAVLAVYGDMDSEGYYTARFGGREGRVPANFIQEVEVADPVTRNRLFNQTLGSPLTSDTFGVLSRHTFLNTPTDETNSTVSNYTKTTVETTGMDCPLPPTHFKVDKVLGSSVLLVTWKPPKMDTPDSNHSNGCLVTGYQMYVNGETKTLISGAAQTKATLVGVNLSCPLTLGISTSAADGKSSKVITIQQQPQLLNTSVVDRSSPNPEPEQHRMFIALYDYDPSKSSPCEHPEFELHLKEGDLVTVCGQEMDDGFVVGELNGQRGLVPANFISEVKQPHTKKTDWRVSMTESLRTTTAEPSAPKLPETTTVMEALFDYNPESDSPNPNPDKELGFKRGEEIIVYGRKHSDGYYSGCIGNKFGLVPSNFLSKKKVPEHITHPLAESYVQPTTPTTELLLGKNSNTDTHSGLSNGLSHSGTQSHKKERVKTKKHSFSVSSDSSAKSPKNASSRSSHPTKSKLDLKKVSGSPSEPKKKQGFKWSK